MTVYVDYARIHYRGMLMCHMFATTQAELHAMAEKLNLRRAWYQKGTTMEHYDIGLTKRAEAIRLGAVPIDSTKDCLRKVREEKAELEKRSA